MAIDFLEELRWRGLLHQCTDEPALRAHLADPENHPRKAYAGFDPTADSLTIGNLVPIMVLVHFARAGHTPVVLMGGGTGLIGDPSGKSAERPLQTEKTVREFVRAQKPIYENVFKGAAAYCNAKIPTPRILNNLDWLDKLGYIEVLRDVGKFFSVNEMIQRDSVRDRLNNREQGISYTEFSYAILQAYDFLHLSRGEGVTIQAGGSDQWGNIVAGTKLIRQHEMCFASDLIRGEDMAGPIDNPPSMEEIEAADWRADHAFGLTAPLITKADGGKFGKTETGAIWLSAPRTTPYAYHQFWLNTADADAVRFLKTFTLLPKEEIERLANEVETNPGTREAQKTLAHHATALLHGREEAVACEQAARALFSGEIAALPESTLRAALAEVPSSDHPKANLEGEGVPLLDLLIETNLASSKRQAREFLAAGSVSINGRKVQGEQSVTIGDLLHGSLIAIRRGKKAWHLTRWS